MIHMIFTFSIKSKAPFAIWILIFFVCLGLVHWSIKQQVQLQYKCLLPLDLGTTLQLQTDTSLCEPRYIYMRSWEQRGNILWRGRYLSQVSPATAELGKWTPVGLLPLFCDGSVWVSMFLKYVGEQVLKARPSWRNKPKSYIFCSKQKWMQLYSSECCFSFSAKSLVCRCDTQFPQMDNHRYPQTINKLRPPVRTVILSRENT